MILSFFQSASLTYLSPSLVMPTNMDLNDNNDSVKPKKTLKKRVVEKISSVKLVKRKSLGPNRQGVVFVKHIPHGFYEKEIEKYFKQFGRIIRFRLSRSKRTGNSKGYGYIEFANEKVAKVAADAMKDYLMFRKRLICEFVPKKDVHPHTFKGWQKPFSRPKVSEIDKKRQNRPYKSGSAANLAAKNLKSKNTKRLAKIAQLGVSYKLLAQD